MENFYNEIINKTRLSRNHVDQLLRSGRITGKKIKVPGKRVYWYVSEEAYNEFFMKWRPQLSYHHTDHNLPKRVYFPNEITDDQKPLIGTGIKGRFDETTGEVTVNLINLLSFVDFLNPNIIINRGKITEIEIITGKEK